MEPNFNKAERRQKATRDVSETSEWSEWQWSREYNCYCRTHSAGQIELECGQHNEATSPGAGPTTTAIEPESTHEYPSNSRQLLSSSMAANVPNTVEDSLQCTSTQHSSQSYLSRSQNAELVDRCFYAETPQTDPGTTSGDDSVYVWTPVSAEPTTPAEQEVPEFRTIRATPRMTERVDGSFSVRRASFFDIGRVFGIAWSTHSSKQSSSEDSFFDKEPLIRNGPVSYRIFQFVIVEMRLNEGHCVCLPVTSDPRGYKRKGVRPQELGFICKSKSKLPAVEGMDLPHVSILPTERFPNPCLMNYSRIYIIECDVEVKEIGFLSPNSVKRLWQNFRTVNPQAQQTDGTLYFRPKRTKKLPKEETSKRHIEDETRERDANKIALSHEAQRRSELMGHNESKRQNVREAGRPSHHATRVSNFSSHTPVQASTSSSPSHTYSNESYLAAVPVNRTSGSTSTNGTIDRRAVADDMEPGGANASNAVEAVESVRLVASLKTANQAGNVYKGIQMITQPVIQLTPVSLVAPQITRQNASSATTVSMSSK